MGITITFVTDVAGSDGMASVELDVRERSICYGIETYVHTVELVTSAYIHFFRLDTHIGTSVYQSLFLVCECW